MKRPELLASTVTPDGMQMTLMLHAGDYYIEVDDREADVHPCAGL